MVSLAATAELPIFANFMVSQLFVVLVQEIGQL